MSILSITAFVDYQQSASQEEDKNTWKLFPLTSVRNENK